MTSEVGKVYQVMNEVQKELVRVGISKNDTNTFDRYKFRGIDAVYNTVSPILAAKGLLILQRVLDLNTIERQSSKGGALYFSTVNVEFDLVAAEDGSKHTIKTYGEGMDRSDKSVNKALTAAYKYALFQAFCIPVEGTPDADQETHEVKSNIISQDVFENLFNQYGNLVRSGQKSAKEFVTFVSKKGALTQEQVNAIYSLEGLQA